MIGGGARSIFRQLALTLSEAIERGEIRVGDLMPTEAVLAQRHGVSRHTVRQALGELRQLGLIESKQGIGSIVVRQRASTAYTETYSSIEELTRFAKGTPIRAYSVDDVVADAGLAGELRGREGQSYIRIAGLRYSHADPRRPVGHVVVHVEDAYGAIRREAWTLNSSIVETLARLYGVEIASIEQEVAVTILSDDVAQRLEAEPGTPALTIRRWYAAANGRIFEASDSCYPMGRFVYRNVLSRRGS